jgi:hypothetical protein
VLAALLVTVTLLAGAADATTTRLDVPPIEECDGIVIHPSQEPWLRISSDGSGLLGVGALMPHAVVGAGTFDFATVYAALRPRLREARRNAELPYVAVGFRWRGAPAVRMFYVEDERLIAELFATANRHARPRRHEE